MRGGIGAGRRAEARSCDLRLRLDGVRSGRHRAIGHATLIGDGLQRQSAAHRHCAAIQRAGCRGWRAAIERVTDRSAAGGTGDRHRLRGGIGTGRRAEARSADLRLRLDGVRASRHRAISHATLVGDGLQRQAAAHRHRAAIQRAGCRGWRAAIERVTDRSAAGGTGDRHRLRGGIRAGRRAEARSADLLHNSIGRPAIHHNLLCAIVFTENQILTVGSFVGIDGIVEVKPSDVSTRLRARDKGLVRISIVSTNRPDQTLLFPLESKIGQTPDEQIPAGDIAGIRGGKETVGLVTQAFGAGDIRNLPGPANAA